MKKHKIVGHFGADDKPIIANSHLEQVVFIDLLDRDNNLKFGMSKMLNDLEEMDIFPTQIGVDLLILAAHIQAADTRISRTTESQDSWTREIKLLVPVSDPGRWSAASSIIKRALDFLTGDLWTLQFRSTSQAELFVSQQESLVVPKFNSLSLFSGGLDSLIGALNLLEEGKTPLFVSHASEGATSKAQNNLFDQLKEHYSQNELDRIRLWMSFPANLVDSSEPEMTTRSRSFLFFALGVVAGTGFKKPFTLQVPENGLIALNVPLDSLRLGSHTTHTTHPFYIARWNELLSALNIEGKLVDPYSNKTKGEMVDECLNSELLQKLIPSSLSCSSPSKGRWDGQPTSHCGYCVPCIIRRAAINHSAIPDNSAYLLEDLRDRPLNTNIAEGRQIRSFQLAIKQLESQPRLAKYLIYNAGPLSDLSDQKKIELADIYKRGLFEVSNLLDSVITEPVV